MSLCAPNYTPDLATARRRADAVGWLRVIFPDVPLPPPSDASDNDLHAALSGGRLLCALLRKICPGALLDDASTDNVGRFRAAVERMGVPTFSAFDLERGQMTTVVTCILALKDRFGARICEDRNLTFLTRSDSEGSRKYMVAKLQRVLTSPIMSEPSNPSLGADVYSPSGVLPMKQGGYADLPGCKISDLMKSSSLDQNNLIKAREEKYQSRIRVLEALAGGQSGQTHMDKDKLKDKGQLPDKDIARLMKCQEEVARLMKEKEDMVRLLKEKEDMVRLLKEKEDMVRLLKEKDNMVDLKKGKVEETQQIVDDEKYMLLKEKDDTIVTLKKEKQEMVRSLKEKEDMVSLLMAKEDMIDFKKVMVEERQRITNEGNDRLLKEKDDTIFRFTKEKEEMVRLLKQKEDIIRLLKENDDMVRPIQKEDMVNSENGSINDKKQTSDDGINRLISEKNTSVVRLTEEKEKEGISMSTKEKEDKADLKKGTIGTMKQSTDEDTYISVKEKSDIIRLRKENEDSNNTIMKLKLDLEALTSLHEENCKLLESKQEDMIKLLADKEDNTSIISQLRQDNLTKENQDILRLMKEKEDGNSIIVKVKREMEALRSSYEEACKLLESKEEDVVRLLADKEDNASIILQLRQELEATKRLHETHSQQLETRAYQVKEESEHRIKEIELMLEVSIKRKREFEEVSKSRIQFWEQKGIVVNQFLGLQVQNVQDLRLCSVSVRHEILNCQKRWLEELAGLGQNLKVVTNAAEKYHATLAENRKLFNEIQELKGNIRVYCRIRPFQPGEDEASSSVEYIGVNGELVLLNPTKQKEGSKNFTFNKVFGPTITQDMVFKDIQPLIRSVLDGYNVCIFAYGQTGSGKTYTMMGPEKATEKEWGVNYRALNDLFNISHARQDMITYELTVQMIEIYNEQIRDLLDGGGGTQKKIGIQNTMQPNGIVVPDATMCPVNSTSHVIELMQTGHGNRAMSATALNVRSSRSHSVVIIHVRGQDLITRNTLRGALHLVDLAGSERVDRSAVTGDRLKEAQHINKSLAALGDVIFSLSQKNVHVPYRNSKLTQVLQTSLGGHAKTLMFVQVNPDVSSYTETLSTLKFAERVSGVELGVARTNKEGKEVKDVRELMDQLSMLKDTISKKDDEIEQLQVLNNSTSKLKSNRQVDHILKHSSSSPGMTSLGKVSSVGSGAASDLDNFSDTSDRQSEAGSVLSIEPEVSGLGDVESDGRLSDASDGGNSTGAETDSSVSSVMDQGKEKASSAAKERLTKAVSRVQKLTVPKGSGFRPKPRDHVVPKPSVPTGARRNTTTQGIQSARATSSAKRGP
ncbi:kinesin-like protein KIN-14D isoform X2 [Hordeum vulgare subsp. vulgare]|uniref:kinesin-like protein KIN-14D isoform X2 n=1 Tax=Hordeum vulgare subsp. vulgare TaxID=112509 RepID=UPI000294FFF9|nr:kinesin-like protein KIN-14D isoform X2 [Hordeum vulgare subsp. vulgare]